ncbi:MAG: hypothetical protein ACFFD6_01860 [Candidatus Thorarchaeota archaeon]
MISFTLRNIDLDQISTHLLKLPDHWERVKDWRYWGHGLELNFQVTHHLENLHLIIREWAIEMRQENLRMTAFFLVDHNLGTCEVFLICAQYLYEVFLRLILMSLLNRDDYASVDISSFLAQNKT